jgi:hypothetical protein
MPDNYGLNNQIFLLTIDNNQPQNSPFRDLNIKKYWQT